MSKEKLKTKVDTITKLATDFCTQKLDKEYLKLTQKLIGKLKRKRPSPLLKGQEKIWAAAVVHALGQVNFLYDKSSEPYISLTDLNAYFGTKKGTVSGRSAEIRKMFKMSYFSNPEFSTQYVKDINPMNKFVMLDGFIFPISELPEEYQKIAREAIDRGEEVQFWTK